MKALLLSAMFGFSLPLYMGCHADADVGSDHEHHRVVEEKTVVVPEHRVEKEKDVTIQHY